MLVRSPAEFYIKYLVSHPAGYNTEAIQRKLKKQRLSDIGKDYIDDLRFDMEVPTPFKPKIKSNVPSQDFLIEEGVFGLWHHNEHVKMALRIPQMPQVQEIVESLVLAGAPDDSLPPVLGRRFDVDFTREAMACYRHYFWNTVLCSRAELRELCYKQALEGSSDLSKSVSDRKAIQKAYYKNPRVLAAELPTAPISVAQVQMLLGFMPARMDPYKLARMNYDMTLRRIAEELLQGGPRAAAATRDYSITLEKLGIQMETMTSPEEDLRAMMQTIQLETEPITTPTINQLTGGNVSDGSFTEVGEEDKVKDEEQRVLR